MTQTAPATAHKLRLDIQGLRTLAVGLVIVYHLFPARLAGGFVGVDIFLVISGFLIVGSLVRGLTKTGKVSLTTFYARRIRRLLPASTVVLLVVMAASLVVLPQSRWQNVARDVVASALQVQNWNQAFGSTSYESAGALVSPVQHFWSLAVEEQFYLVIPLMLLLAAALGRVFKLGAKSACMWFLALLAVASFAHSVVFSQQSHDVAYFATTTRMWELAAGGLAALAFTHLRLNYLAQLAAGWAGLGMVLLSAVTFHTSMAFPGYIALLPVVGTMLIIAAGSPTNTGPDVRELGISRFLSMRPVTYLGDISYSLYLWHWPVIVFYVLIRGYEPGLVGGAGILVLSLVLAALSYHQIEQRFRFGKPVRQGLGRRYRPVVLNRSAYGLAGVLIVLSCVAAAVPWSVVEMKTQGLQNVLASPNYPGAMAFDRAHRAVVPKGMPVLPDPAVAMKDLPPTSKDECGVYDPAKMSDSQCLYGDLGAKRSLVIIGDSHAAQYVGPLAEVGAEDGWKIRAMVRNGCPFSLAPPSSAKTTYWNCSEQNKVSLNKILKMKPEQVVIAGMTPYGYKKALKWGWSDEKKLLDGYVGLMQPLAQAGIKVSVILDTPYPGFSVPDCVATKSAEAGDCDIPRHAPEQGNDPLKTASIKVQGVRTIDINDYLCEGATCPPIIGNVLVFRDNHMTNTFSMTLAVPLRKALGL